MREFKFRAWDKEESEFIDIKSFGFLESGDVWYVQAIDEYEREIEPPYFTGEDELVIMQYTGLIDINNTEVFEGDILKFTNDDFAYVSFYEGKYITITTYEGKYTARSDFEDMDLDEALRIGEVIGNIYENPELLK